MADVEGNQPIEEKMRMYSHNLKQLRSRLDKDLRVGSSAAGLGKVIGAGSADTGSTPAYESPSGPFGNLAVRQSSCSTEATEATTVGTYGDRSMSFSASKKPGSTITNGSEQVVALRDADSNLIYSARHVYAPIAEHHGGKAFIPSIPLDKENHLTCKASRQNDEEASNFESSWVSLLTDHRPETPTGASRLAASMITEQEQYAARLIAEQEQQYRASQNDDKDHQSPVGLPYPPVVEHHMGQRGEAYPPVVEYHTGGKAPLPATERSNGATGRSASRTSIRSAPNSPQPREVARLPRRKPAAVEVPVQSMGYSRGSLGAAQRGRGANGIALQRPRPGVPPQGCQAVPSSRKNSVSARPGLSSGASAPALVHRAVAPGRPGGTGQDQLSCSSSAIPRSPSQPRLDGSTRSLASVKRMGSSPRAAPSSPQMLSRAVSFDRNSPPASPSPQRVRRNSDCLSSHSPCTSPNVVRASSSSYVPASQPGSPLQPPQPQPWSPGSPSLLPRAFGSGVAGPFSTPCHLPSSRSFASASAPSSPLGSQAHMMGGHCPPLPSSIHPGAGFPSGPVTDPNFLRHTFGANGMPPLGSAPPPIPLRPPPSSCNMMAHACAPSSAPSLAMPLCSVGSFAAEDHSLIGNSLSWAPVRGKDRGNLGAGYGAPAASERARSPMDFLGGHFGSAACPYGNMSASSSPIASAPCSPHSSASIPMAYGTPYGSMNAPVPVNYNVPVQGNYAYPSSPPSGLRHYDIGVPSSPGGVSQYAQLGASPPRKRDVASRSPARPGSSPLPPPPPPPAPLLRTNPDLAMAPPQPGWAPVVESHKDQARPRLPRVGESMVCTSPHVPGVCLTNPNLQATNPNLQECASIVLDEKNRSYPQYSQASQNKDSTWLRPPFGTQHQVSKMGPG